MSRTKNDGQRPGVPKADPSALTVRQRLELLTAWSVKDVDSVAGDPEDVRAVYRWEMNGLCLALRALGGYGAVGAAVNFDTAWADTVIAQHGGAYIHDADLYPMPRYEGPVRPAFCPHAAPHVYCQTCKVSPCPLGLGHSSESGC